MKKTVQTLAAQAKDKRGNSGKEIKLSQVLVVQPPKRDAADLGTWKSAMRAADRGKRNSLVNLYNNLLMDTVLSDAVEKRIRKVTNADWVFLSNGEEVIEMADFIDTPEFEELLREIMLTIFYGKSVIELGFSPQGFNIYSIPRENLDTAKKIIKRDLTDEQGISYENDEYLLNLGKDNDLGLFLKTSPHAIFKRNGGSDYAQFCELFGTDILAGYYDPEDETGRQEMEAAFQNRGAGGSVVMSNKSKIETIGRSSGEGGKNGLHRSFLDYCDEQMLIGVVSQTMTTKDGSSLAQGKVHEATEDDVNKSDRRWVRRVLNRHLVPLLEKRGYPVKQGFFKTVEEDRLDPEQRMQIAKEVDEITEDGVDDSFFYETFGLPKGNKKQKQKENPTPESDPNTPDPTPEEKKKDTSDPKEEKGKRTKVKAKNLSVLGRLRNFFAHAPR
ncbi:head morphogenesis protein [Elizabethkingia anophelis]|nr:head morphogenesis protein [Elizabethkingia anophelis]MDV3766798.1 head morphogenesis protein [Elizabethkingia anophelis]